MSRAPKVDVEIREIVERLAFKGLGAAEIYRHLEQSQQRRQLKSRIPTLRSIQRLVRELAPPDTSERWTLADSDPEESRAILDVVAAMVDGTGGRVWPTRELVEWIVRVRAAAPTMEPWQVYVFASAYRAMTKRGGDTNQLDRVLAFKPWESEDAQTRFNAVVGRLVKSGEYEEGVLINLHEPWTDDEIAHDPAAATQQ